MISKSQKNHICYDFLTSWHINIYLLNMLHYIIINHGLTIFKLDNSSKVEMHIESFYKYLIKIIISPAKR